MQNLIEGEVYEGIYKAGPFKGSSVIIKYLRPRKDVHDGARDFEVMEDRYFEGGGEDPEDDGWWLVGERVCLSEACFNFSLYNPSLENK